MMIQPASIEPVFRPPSEAYSLILQVTIGCSWNNCTFCEMYTQPHKRFRFKPMQELEKELADMQGDSGISFDGMVSVVDILKGLEKEVARPILDQLRDKDEGLFAQVDRLLLIFEDLIALSDRDIQTILKHISSDDLVKAMKGGSDEVGDRFFDNMSQRAAEIMREDMAVMGPMKLADVEDAQQIVLKIIRKLDDDGAITLSASDDMV